MISVIPELRVGRNACSVSIVRLVTNPRMMVIAAVSLIAGFEDR